MFLEQYWGGPRTYSDQRGHPRLRMRHAPFKVGPDRARRLAALHADRRRRGRPRRRPPRPALAVPGRTPPRAWSTVTSDRDRVPPSRGRRTECTTPCDGDRRSVPRRLARSGPCGGATPWSTRSTSGRSPTPTATASATSTASAPGWATSSCSASTRCGSPRSTAPRWPTTATTWPTRATSTRCSATSPRSTALVADAHEHGLRVTDRPGAQPHLRASTSGSSAALDAAPGSPERARYLFRHGRGHDGARAAEQLAQRLRRAGVDAGRRTRTAARASGTCTCSPPSSPT